MNTDNDTGDWVVLKYGGTSVSTPETWKKIVARVKKLLPKYNVWVTVSAISQVTNRLLKCLDECIVDSTNCEADNDNESLKWILDTHKQFIKASGINDTKDAKFVETQLEQLCRIVDGIKLTQEVSPRLQARVLAFGELCSSRLGRAILERELGNQVTGLEDDKVAWVDSRKLLVAYEREAETDSDRYLNADVEAKENKEIALKHSNGCRVVISQGFIASTSDRSNTCVLGRGGSDTSGALFAALLGADRYEIWTDVYGMFSSDPRKVPGARHILEISYREAQELAAMGAKVLHPRCLSPASMFSIPVEIHNTMDPETGRFTTICAPDALTDTKSTVMAVAKRANQVLLTITNLDMWGASGFLSKTFAPFERFGISVDLIATSQYAVSMTLDHIPEGVGGPVFKSLQKELKKHGKVDVKTNCSVVSIVGRRLRTVLHHMSDVFKALSSLELHLVSQSTEDLNFSFVISSNSDSEVELLVTKLHETLFTNKAFYDPSRSQTLFGLTYSQLVRGPPSPKLISKRKHRSRSSGSFTKGDAVGGTPPLSPARPSNELATSWMLELPPLTLESNTFNTSSLRKSMLQNAIGTIASYVDSVAAAVAAERGGAKQICLGSNLVQGGVTPSFGLISKVVKTVNIPVYVIIRPRPGGFCYTEEEIEIMITDIQMCDQAEVAGVVIGVVSAADFSQIDYQTLRKLTQDTTSLKILLHPGALHN